MKGFKLGILGLGSRSTLFYLEQLNTSYNQHFGAYSTCPYTLVNTDFNEINPFLPNQFEQLEPILLKYVKSISKKDTLDTLLIPNISLHETYYRLNMNLPIIDPVLLALEKLRKMNAKQVVIIGSSYTMYHPFFKNQFAEHHIEIIPASEEHMVLLDQLRIKIYESKETEEDLENYKNSVTHYAKETPVIIACTELSIPIDFSNNNIIDMARLQITTVIDRFKLL